MAEVYPHKNQNCACPKFMAPDSAVILGPYVYRDYISHEEGYTQGFCYLGTSEELGVQNL
jgi:hypothetical protein